MNSKFDSRSPLIDTELCVQQAGGRYDLILVGAHQLRELRRQHKENPDRYMTAVDALLDIQNGSVDPKEYLKKIRPKNKQSN